MAGHGTGAKPWRPLLLVVGVIAGASGMPGVLAQSQPQEPMEQAICRLVETAAKGHDLPVAPFTRLIWRESSLAGTAESHAGSAGLVPAMPKTAGPSAAPVPFDPEAAIPAAARHLVGLRDRFGNLGLAAAGYSAGPDAVARWLEGGPGLPEPTQDYVRFVSGRAVEDWRAGPSAVAPRETAGCPATVSGIRANAPSLMEGAYAPYGVQLSGNTTKESAIRSYQDVAARFPALLGDQATLVVGSSLPSRGRGAYYRVRLPAPDGRSASAFCERLRQAGGTCIVLRN